MSKAFTRESDDVPERPVLPRQPSLLPPGAVNYMTVDGERRLREELEKLIDSERPRLAALAPDPETKRQLMIVDQRIQYLQQSLHSAVVTPPPATPDDRVRFGTTVTVRDKEGEITYRIVGVDEADSSRDWLSWLSPLAKALLNARVGERIQFKAPAGILTLEIVSVRYE